MNFNRSQAAKAFLGLQLQFMADFAANAAQIQASTNLLHPIL